MSVIDMHVHIYPDKIARKATQSVGAFYNLEMSEDAGSVGQLCEVTEHTPIERCVVCSVAVHDRNVRPINDFIGASCAADSRFVGLAAMHQDLTNVEEELDHAQELGLVGVKIHPDTQRVNMDDERLMAIFELCERRGLALLMHCGDYRYDYSHPRRLKRVLHEFPQLRICAAHFGGWSIYDLALEYLEDETCLLDMSSSMRLLGLRRTRELVEIYGSERMMFGSDFPMWNPGEELQDFTSLGFSAADYERMCWKNAECWLARDLA